MLHTVRAPDLSLPRAEWPDHPNYPHQALLVKSHASFRLVNQVLVDRAARGATARAIEQLYRAWKAAMRNHEAYEEYKLYPYLERRWGLSLAACEAGHRELAEIDVEVRAHASAGGVASSALHEALVAHQEVLLDHLDLEERIVVPALLALSPAEFEDYTMSDIRGLLQRLDASKSRQTAVATGDVT